MTMTIAETVCERCGEPRPDGFSHYCSRRCKRAAERARRQARDEAGIPPGPARTPRTPEGKARRRRKRVVRAYWKFESKTVPGKRVQVPTTPDAQRKAELLIERGCCAYRNAQGLIRDIGVPKKPEHRGRVWGPKVEAEESS